MSDREKSGNIKLRLPRSLHEALKINAEKEGVSMNQYCLYLLSTQLSKEKNKNGKINSEK